jgi:glycosyltransferase involved in cell wall biosynthesis
MVSDTSDTSTAAAVPGVLLVTGAYHPEISAAAVQCRAAAAAIGGRARVSVLTTAVDPSLPSLDTIDGVSVHRVAVDVRSRASKALASLRLGQWMLKAAGSYDVVHVHGCSQKNVPVAILARLLGKPIVLSLHTSGQDEPAVVKRRGALAYWALTRARLVLCVSPDLCMRWTAANLPADRLRLTPNGVDTDRFRPADAVERRALRRELGWSDAQPVVLFVGFFSRDKRPDLLFRAWRRIATAGGVAPKLVFVGAKSTGYYEIDASLEEDMRREAAALGRGADVISVAPAHDVERYFRAADVYVMPSIREAHPLALLEAMACGLPCLATRIAGATDVLIDDGANGRLFPADDEASLAEALRQLLADPGAARAMGARARATVVARYDIRRTAEQWLDAYATALGVGDSGFGIRDSM